MEELRDENQGGREREIQEALDALFEQRALNGALGEAKRDAKTFPFPTREDAWQSRSKQ